MKPKHKIQKTYEEIEPSEFSFTITTIAVSQICQSVGFKRTQYSALETLSLIATKYLQTLAKSAVSFTNASNRTQSNLLDVINAIHDLSSSAQGFPGASTLHNSNNYLMESSVLKGIFGFVNSIDEIPFAKPIPRKDLNSCNSISQKELNSRRLHIPKWLPEFPDESTYNDNTRIDDEKLWEESDLVLNKCGECVGDFELNEDCDKGNGNGDLAVERRRVSFEIGGIDKGGVKVRNGLCRGGKRVCWNGTNKSDGIGEIHEKWSGLKKRR